MESKFTKRQLKRISQREIADEFLPLEVVGDVNGWRVKCGLKASVCFSRKADAVSACKAFSIHFMSLAMSQRNKYWDSLMNTADRASVPEMESEHAIIENLAKMLDDFIKKQKNDRS